MLPCQRRMPPLRLDYTQKHLMRKQHQSQLRQPDPKPATVVQHPATRLVLTYSPSRAALTAQIVSAHNTHSVCCTTHTPCVAQHTSFHWQCASREVYTEERCSHRACLNPLHCPHASRTGCHNVSSTWTSLAQVQTASTSCRALQGHTSAAAVPPGGHRLRTRYRP